MRAIRKRREAEVIEDIVDTTPSSGRKKREVGAGGGVIDDIVDPATAPPAGKKYSKKVGEYLKEPSARGGDENEIMYAFKEMARKKRLDMFDANEMVTELFPGKEYLGPNPPKGVKIHIRRFTAWALTILSKKNIEEALKYINIIYTELYPMKSSLDTILSPDVRNPLKDRFGESSEEYKMAKSLVKITYAEKTALLKAQKDKVYENYANRIDFTADEVIAVVKEHVNSEDPLKRAVVLLIASGCRPIELFERARFKANEEMGPSWIWQDYLAKKKGKDGATSNDGGDGELLTKPIIYLTAEDFITRVKSMRSDLRKRYPKFTQESGQLSTSISTRANKLAKEMFQHKGGLTLYTARKLYVNISYELFRKTTDIFGKNPGYGAWANKVLGHSENSLNTALNYSTVDVSTGKVTTDDMIIRQVVLENKVGDIEERLEQESVPKAAEKPPDHSTTNEIVLDKLKLVDAIYQRYIKDNNKVPSQTALEKAAKGKVPRAMIRLYYKQKKD